MDMIREGKFAVSDTGMSVTDQFYALARLARPA